MNGMNGMAQLMVGASTGGKQSMKLQGDTTDGKTNSFTDALTSILQGEGSKKKMINELNIETDEKLLLKMLTASLQEEIPEIISPNLDGLKVLENYFNDDQDAEALKLSLQESLISLMQKEHSVSENSFKAENEVLNPLQLEMFERVDPLVNEKPDSLNERFEKYLEVISEFIDELPLEESFLSEEMYAFVVESEFFDEDERQLLALIPEHWAEEIESLFQNNRSIEGLLEEIKENGDPVSLLALLVTFAAKEDQHDPFENRQGIHAIQQVVSTFFPGMQQEEKYQGFRQLMSNLTEHLRNRDNLFSNTESLTKAVPNKSLMSMINMNSTKYAELAYLNQKATANEKTSSSQHQQTSLLFDSTNSHMTRLQQFTLHTGEQQPDRPSQEQFIRQFQSLLSRSTFQQLGNGIQQLSLKLHPASLGRIDITIQQVNGVITASMMTSTSVTRDLMEGQLSQLRSAFQAQNIQVDKIEVSQQQNQQQLLKDSNQDESRKDEENQKETTDQSEDDESEIEMDFAEFLEETINTQA